MKKMFNNKKGATLDNIYLLAKVFGVAIFFLVIWLVWNSMTTSDLNDKLWDQTPEGQSIRENTTAGINKLDFMFMMFYIGAHLGVIVLAFLLRSHPVVFAAGIMITVVLVLIAAPLSNAWNDVADEDIFSTSITKLPKTDFLMDNLPMFEVIFAFITLVSFAGFARSEEYI